MKSPDHNGEDNFARDFMVSPSPSCRLLSPAPEPPAAFPGRAARALCATARRGAERRAPTPRTRWSRRPAGGETAPAPRPPFPSSRARGPLRGRSGRKGSGPPAEAALSAAADHLLFLEPGVGGEGGLSSPPHPTCPCWEDRGGVPAPGGARVAADGGAGDVEVGVRVRGPCAQAGGRSGRGASSARWVRRGCLGRRRRVVCEVSRGLPDSHGPRPGLRSPENQPGGRVGGQSDFRWRGECVRGAGRVIPKETFGLPRGRCRGRRGCGCHFLSGVGAGSSGTIVLVGRRRRGCGPEP